MENFLDFSNNQAVLLAVLGYFGFVFREIPASIWGLIKQKFSSSIEAYSQNNMVFEFTMEWLIKKFPQLKEHIQFIGYNSIRVGLSEGIYFFMIDPFTYCFIHKYTIQNGTYNGVMYVIRCQVIGLNRKSFLKEYSQMLTNAMPDTNSNIQIKYFTSAHGGYMESMYSKKRSFDNIYLPDDIKKQIIDILDRFISSKEYYEKHGITYKLGILLSGDPGSGKSSIAKAIASYLQWEIYYITAEGGELDSSLINEVILLEDIDCLVSESRTGEPKERTQNRLSMHTILNYIDGSLSPSSCIFVATTNYPERLDPALLRPGRFDYHFCVKHADREIGKKVCDSFSVDYDILDDIKFPCSVAVIQNKIIMDKLKKQ